MSLQTFSIKELLKLKKQQEERDLKKINEELKKRI